MKDALGSLAKMAEHPAGLMSVEFQVMGHTRKIVGDKMKVPDKPVGY